MNVNVATMALARQRAIKAAKLQFQRQGLKPAQMARRVIVAAAKDYLGNHPELIAEAKVIVERWLAEGFFGKRAQRAWASAACIKQLNIEQSQIEGSQSNGQFPHGVDRASHCKSNSSAAATAKR